MTTPTPTPAPGATTAPAPTTAPTPTAARRGQGGFTLVEVMASVVVFALGFVGVMATMLGSVGANGQSRDMSGGIQIAESVSQEFSVRGRNWTGSLPIATELPELAVAANTWQMFTSFAPMSTGEPIDVERRAKSTLPAQLRNRAMYCVHYQYITLTVGEEVEVMVRASWGRGGFVPANCTVAVVNAALAAGTMSATLMPTVLRRLPR